MADSDSIYRPFIDAGFKQHRFTVKSHAGAGVGINTFVYTPASGQERPQHTLVLLHGHPQSLVIWHRVGPQLVQKLNNTRIVVPDLRGHGQSDAVKVARNDRGEYQDEQARATYSKREMASDVVEVLDQIDLDLKSSKFSLVGHDRGARVAHRLCLDYPDRVDKLLLLDILPTVDHYEQADSRFAAVYWHWYFLIQPYPFPEQMITANPRAYLEKLTTRFAGAASPQVKQGPDAVHPPGVLASYEATLSDAAYVEATCEDYRQSCPTGIDFEHDKRSRTRGDKVQPPTRVLWGQRGVVELLYGREKALSMWRGCCRSFDEEGSRGVAAGHYIPEEAPEMIVEEVLAWFDVS